MTTPYQIRADLLVLAKDILDSQSRAKKLKSTNVIHPHGEEIITTEQVIAEAKKLNEFVSQSFNKNIVEGDLIVRGSVIADEDVSCRNGPKYRGKANT